MDKKSIMHILRTLLLSTALLLFTAVFFTEASSFTFSRNLTVGNRGEDVFELQKTLNLRLETRLATIGPGSPGEETTYFGPLTRAAVIKYQDLFAADILHPLNLTKGTGFFGPSTRAKLNVVSGETEFKTGTEPIRDLTQQKQEQIPFVVDVSTPPSFIFDLPSVSDKLDFYYISKQNGRKGEIVTMYGTGFTAVGNTVSFGSNKILNIESGTSRELSFKIPELPPGRYQLSISNNKGKIDARHFRILNNEIIPAPVVKKVSPPQGGQGSLVTITGAGFSTSENLIYTTFDEIENVASSDGTTLTFTVPFFTDTIDSGNGLPAVEESGGIQLSQPKKIDVFPLFINVENNNGVSNESIFLIDDFKNN